jgi:hypothetical protein
VSVPVPTNAPGGRHEPWSLHAHMSDYDALPRRWRDRLKRARFNVDARDAMALHRDGWSFREFDRALADLEDRAARKP